MSALQLGPASSLGPAFRENSVHGANSDWSASSLFSSPSVMSSLLALLCSAAIGHAAAFQSTFMIASLQGKQPRIVPGSGMRLLAVNAASQRSSAAGLQAPILGGTSFGPAVSMDGGRGGRGGGALWSGGGGGGGGGDDEEVSGEVAALLKKYNLKASDLPPGALALPLEKLARFLAAFTAAGTGLNRWLINSWPAWRDKMLADPDFAYKLFIEETVGLGIAMSGTIAARGKDLLKELDYFLTDCAVGAVLNFVLIWLLAPTVAVRAATSGSLGTYISTLPAFVLAEGKFTVGQRAMAGLYKGSLFAFCGFLGSVGGTTLAFMLLKIRQLLDPLNSADKPLPNVVNNSLGWASFMFVSTNPRYQIVNGIERGVTAVASPAVSKASSLALRTGNNLIGGSTWVLWARFIGLQKKAGDEGDPKKKKKRTQ